MLISKASIAAVALSAGSFAIAQDYLDFDSIPGLPENPAVRVDLDPTMLGFVSQTAALTDPAAATLLSSLQGVKIRIYEGIEDVEEVSDYVDEIASRLARDDWQQVVRVQDDGDVSVFMRGDETTVTGMTAMIVDDSDAIFVNVAGSITPQQFAQLATQLGASGVMEAFGALSLPTPTAD